MNWLLLVLILAYPGLRVKPEWYHHLSKAQVYGHYAPMPDDPDKIGWYDIGAEAIHVVFLYDDGEMMRRLSHETMHYLAYRAELGDWERFAKLALKEIRRGGYSRHQALSAKGMIAYGGGEELHAEVPGIFEGRIPKSLWGWYPWFEFETMVKVKEGE